ncbi:hypothetical protein MD484_g9090, partial [Candolleomyces efflorescens]
MSASTSAVPSTSRTNPAAALVTFPTLKLYPVLGPLYLSLKPYLHGLLSLPTTDAERTAVVGQIMTHSAALNTASEDLRVAGNADLFAFRAHLSRLLEEVNPALYKKFQFCWSWIASPIPRVPAFEGFADPDAITPQPPVTMTQAPPPPPETMVPPNTSGSQPSPPPVLDDEGLYTIPSPASDVSDNHPFGVVPGWVPQLHSDISNHWAWLREMHKRQELPDPRKKAIKEAPPCLNSKCTQLESNSQGTDLILRVHYSPGVQQSGN